jgi:hypothetical protein
MLGALRAMLEGSQRRRGINPGTPGARPRVSRGWSPKVTGFGDHVHEESTRSIDERTCWRFRI